MSQVLIVSPSQKEALDRYARMRYFEVPYEQAEYVLDGTWTRPLKELRKRKFKDGVFTAEFHYERSVPNDEAIAEFEAFVQGWRDKGWNDLADEIVTSFDGEKDYPTVDLLTKQVPDFRVVRIENPKFFSYREATPEELQAEHEERMARLADAPPGSYLTPDIMTKAFESLRERANQD